MLKLILFLFLSILSLSAQIDKELTYDKYTLKDTYTYGKVTRKFQWDKISNKLDALQDFENSYNTFGYLTNYKNQNGMAPLINGNTIDRFGLPRNQAIPLYSQDNTSTPDHYEKDGSLVAILNRDSNFSRVKVFNKNGQWLVPNRFLKTSSVQSFSKAIFVDRRNQNLAVLEKVGGVWKVRSMTPATTGQNKAPYSLPTPLGTFVIQQKKYKMEYYKDGTKTIEGYAPYASRFTRGAYLHGVPVNNPKGSMIEYSQTLGTVPRSHMCVRNPTSLAKYIYSWAPIGKTVVFVIE